jgi:hypothetical protein
MGGRRVNVLVVVAEEKEKPLMQRLLKRAGLQGDVFVIEKKFTSKPAMKKLREYKPVLDKHVLGGYDATASQYAYVIAAGETASRLVLDTSSVNITKLRGREFDYAFGTKALNKKAKE